MISIRLDGDTRKLLRRLKHLSDIDKKGINSVLASSMRTSTRERFKEEKSPEGKKWIPSIRAVDQAGVTLSKTSRLKNSIRCYSSSIGFAVGTNTIYARTHQYGDKGRIIRAKTPKGLTFKNKKGNWIRKEQVTVNIPERPFLGYSEEDFAEIKATIEEAIREES